MELKNIVVTQIYDIVTVLSEKGKCSKMENRKSYGLSLCYEGKITYIQNGKEYASNENTAIILPKGATYSIKREEAGRFPVINFDCLDFLCDTITVIPIDNATELLASYEQMEKLWRLDGDRLQMFSIFYTILHQIHSCGVSCEIDRAVSIIRKDFCDPSLTNARLATACRMSEVYFRKLFIKNFGNSPKQFIIELRIQKAKRLLREGRLTVAQISEMCGFSNSYHFCRMFKQRTGAAPTVYGKENLIY